MIQILELIKHLGLGIASLIICSITMADIKKTKDFIKAIEEVRSEYPEDAIEKKIPVSFIATVAATETGNFQFKNAPTAEKGNNYFGMKPMKNKNGMKKKKVAKKLKGFSKLPEAVQRKMNKKLAKKV